MLSKVKTLKRGTTFAAEVRLAPGPRAMGDTGDGSYTTLFGYAWAAVLDRVERRFRLFQAQVPGEGPWPLHDPRGAEVAVWVEVEVPPLPHPVEEVAHMGLAFDQAARHVVVYERQGEVWIRQWDPVSQNYVMRGPFPGVDPVLINDATVGYFPSDSDILLFHLTPDRKTLIMRGQRQLYNTPHTIQTFETPVVLDQAVALPYQIELLGSLAGVLDATGYVLRSELYPVRVSDIGGTFGFASPTEWNYIPLVVDYEAQEASLSASLEAPTNWGYIPIVVDYAAHESTQASLSPPLSWNYVPIVVLYQATENVGQFGIQPPLQWSYALVVAVYNAGIDTPTTQASFGAPTTWEYTPA